MANENKKELTLVRIFDASRELVWKAWTDPKLLAQWWGPNGVTNPTCEFEARPEGVIHIVMVAGEELGELKGAHWPMKGTVKEIKEPSRLVFTSVALEDEKGNSLFENLNMITFEEMGDKTKVTLHVQVVILKESPAVNQALAGMETGWSQSLSKLAAFVTK